MKISITYPLITSTRPYIFPVALNDSWVQQHVAQWWLKKVALNPQLSWKQIFSPLEVLIAYHCWKSNQCWCLRDWKSTWCRRANSDTRYRFKYLVNSNNWMHSINTEMWCKETHVSSWEIRDHAKAENSNEGFACKGFFFIFWLVMICLWSCFFFFFLGGGQYTGLCENTE